MAVTTTTTPSEKDYALAKSICRPNLVAQRLAEGRLSYSFGLTVCPLPDMVLMAARAGYHAILMNMEHSPFNIETMALISTTCLNIGITPIVVVPALTSDWISRCLDSGAQGIIVPRTNTAADAAEIVKYAKYRPVGERPLAMPPQMQFEWLAPTASMAVMNETTLAMPMIETVEGLENCEEIAAVPGVDALFVGTFDLSDDMGLTGQYDDPKVWNALLRIAGACKKASVDGRKVYMGVGGMEPRPDLLKKLSEECDVVRFTMGGRDTSVLYAGMKAQAAGLAAIDSSLA